MKKIINFLFPGDKIELTLNDSSVMNFMIYNSMLTYVNECSFMLGDPDTGKNLIFNDKYGYFLTTHQDRLLLKEVFVGETKERVVTRIVIYDKSNKTKEYSCNDFCKYSCSIRDRCLEKDEFCEYKDYNIPSQFLLGDEVEFRFSAEFIKANPKRNVGVVSKLFNVEIYSCFCVRSIGGGSEFSSSVIGKVKLLSKNSIAIKHNPCKVCFLESCNNCELKLFKNVEIVWRK